MKHFLLFLLLMLSGILAINWGYTQMTGSDEIEYRGQAIKLTRKYNDYDAYKNDTDNILAAELPKVERLITQAPVSKTFESWAAFSKETSHIKFPGYSSGPGPRVASTTGSFIISKIEIPSAPPPGEKFRYFVLEQFPDEHLLLVDDFVAAGYPQFAKAIFSEGRLRYLSKNGVSFREIEK